MTTDAALSLLVIAVGTFLAPLMARRAGVPTAVGEILFGILVGRAGINLVAETATVHFLADLGFIFLMFIAGLEIDFSTLERSRTATRRGAATVMIMFVAGGIIVYGLDAPLVLALLLPALSIGVLVPVLREGRLLNRPLGQAILVVGTIGEVMTLICFALYEAWAFYGMSLHLVINFFKLGVIIVAAILLLRLLHALAWWAPERFTALVDHDDPSELGVRGALALLFILVAGAALLHIELIIGAFLAGAVMRYVFRGVHALEGKIAGTGFGFFIPVFFIQIGVNFDLSVLERSGTVLGAVSLLVAMVALRLLAAPLFLSFGPRRAVAGVLLLGAPLTLLVAIAEVAHRAGRIDDAAESAIVLSALLGALVLPPAARRLLA